MKPARTFLGYAVFSRGEPFPCSDNTVTRDKLYLRRCALYKLNINVEAPGVQYRRFNAPGDRINRTWKRYARRLGLSLRRVYAEAPR